MVLPTEVRDSVRYAEMGPPTTLNRSFLLLHGMGASLDFWCAIAPALGKVDRTLAIDLPGFGQSKAPPQGLTLESVAGAIIEFCQTMNVKDCTVVAHSLGGFVALKLAAMDPGLCRRLILVDAAPVRAAMILRKPALAVRSPVLAATMAAQFLGGFVPLRAGSARLIANSKVLRTLALWPFVARPASTRRSPPALCPTPGGRARWWTHSARAARSTC